MAESETITFGPYALNATERLLCLDGEPAPIGSRSLDILIALVERAGEVVSQRELMAQAWPGLIVEDGNLRVMVSGLRKALGEGRDGARYIVTVPGRGYCFVAAVERGMGPSPAPSAAPGLQALAPTFPTNLPAPLRRMVGRAEAVAQLCEQLAQQRFVTIVGPGGMGKTTVAIAVAHSCLEVFEGAVYFVDFGTLTNPLLVAATVASTLGVAIQADDPLPSLLSWLAERSVLIVFDSCEHLVDAVARLAERLFVDAPLVSLLATSREALRVEGEQVHLLAPLAAPAGTELTAANAMASPAVQLFMERAFASGKLSDLKDEEATVVTEICHRLDGLPLALELAGSRVGAYGVHGTADLLNSRFRLLWEGRRSALPRHQTLQAMLDWSYNLLSERERLVFSRLSVFVGPFELDAAHAVASDDRLSDLEVSGAISSLIDKSLLASSVVGGVTQLRLLDTTRSYAADKLALLNEAESLRGKHARYYAEALQTPHAHDGVRADAAGKARFAQQAGNIRAALTWAFSPQGDDTVGCELAARASTLLLGSSLLTECRHWCELALKTGPADSTLQLELQESLAVSAMFTRGNSPEILSAIEQALQLADRLGERQHQLNLLAGLHIFMTRIGDFGGALDVAQRSVKVANETGEPAARVMAEFMLGTAYHLAGDQSGALRHCEQGLALSTPLGSAGLDFFRFDHRIRALVVLARVRWLCGRPDRALLVARQVIEEARRRNDPIDRSIAMIYATTVLIWRGDADEAAENLAALIRHAKKHSLGPYAAVGLAMTGELAISQGDFATGVAALREALETLHVEQHHVLTTTFHRALAEGLAGCGEVDEADTVISTALARVEAEGDTFDLPELLRTRAEVGLAAGRIDAAEAEALLWKAIRLAESQEAHGLHLRAAGSLAQLWADRGRFGEAHALLLPVYERFSEGLDTADLGVAGRRLAAWKAGRAPDARAGGNL
ncbi:MAG: winged helix-turn-helix domain-containing protein [Caulobacteraceae bacterium]